MSVLIPRKFKVVYHYSKDSGLGSDYWDVELFEVGYKEPIVTLGCMSDDHPEEFIEGFIRGIELATGVRPKVTTKHKADRD